MSKQTKQSSKCPICGDSYTNSISEDGLRTFDHPHENGVRTCEKPIPRNRCPDCNSQLMVESKDPLEEYCIDGACQYYRAQTLGGIIRE